MSYPKHNHAKDGNVSETYTVWQNMRKRCLNPNDPCFKNYGKRGIKICKEWDEFINFLKDMGERPPGLTLDRIDNNKGYYKENCRWVDRFTQNQNTRRNHLITYNGETKPLGVWARSLNMSKKTLFNRIVTYNWTIERALTEKVNINCRKKSI